MKKPIERLLIIFFSMETYFQSPYGKTVEEFILPYLKKIEDRFEFTKCCIAICFPYMHVGERYDDGIDETGNFWDFDLRTGEVLPEKPDMNKTEPYYRFGGTFDTVWDDNDHIIGLNLIMC